MKYLFRLLGVIIVWSILIILVLVGWLGYNLLMIVWYSDLWALKISEFYFYIERNDIHSVCYKTPLDMLNGKLTKIYK